MEFQLQHFDATHNKKLRVLGFLRFFFFFKKNISSCGLIRWCNGTNPPAMQETADLISRSGRPLGEEMAPHSLTLAWEIAWTEEPGGLQSRGSQRVGHDLSTERVHLCACTHTHTHTHTHAHTSCSVIVKVCPRHRPSFSSALSPSAT